MARCLECGEPVEDGTFLCFPDCGERDRPEAREQFDDFFSSFQLIQLESQTSTQKVKRLKPEEIGMKIPSWQEELSRILSVCRLSSGPQDLSGYICLVHHIAIDKRISFWNGLVITVFFFKREWCIRRYYDPGAMEDPKRKIKERTRGWKYAIFNPFDYLEWSMPGFAKWVNCTMACYGYTRKALVAKAEQVIHDETMLACIGT